MKQPSKNYKELNFANILVNSDASNFAKICDNCEEVFLCDIEFAFKRDKIKPIKCPICFAVYYVVWNDMNNFCYLEYVRQENFYYYI